MTDPTASAQQQIRCSSIRPHLVACQGTDFCLHPIVQLRQGAGSGIFDNCDLAYHIMSYQNHVQVYFWMMHQWHDTQPERPQHSTRLHLCIFLSSKILWPDRSQQRVLKTHRVFWCVGLVFNESVRALPHGRTAGGGSVSYEPRLELEMVWVEVASNLSNPEGSVQCKRS